jgi:uncharacterized protein (DUF2126 family)
VTKPYSEAQWQAMLDLGHQVDEQLAADDVRLTMGGEPTFVSIDDMDGAEWNFTALSAKKRELAEKLFLRLQQHFAVGAMLHFGQGKWYPGEPLPRWALGCWWRADGKALWRDPALIALAPAPRPLTDADALRYICSVARELGLDERFVIPAYEDIAHAVDQEQRWPENFDPVQADLNDADERKRIAGLIGGGLGAARGYVLPLKPLPRATGKGGSGADKAAQVDSQVSFRSSRWPLRREHLYLIPGDSPLGLRLPLASLPWVAPEDIEVDHGRDPFDIPGDLPPPAPRGGAKADVPKAVQEAREVVHTALCVEVRAGMLHVFLPPVALLEDFVALLDGVEAAAAVLKLPVRLEGYTPPADPRLQVFRITPDPGVIEVNIHPAKNWPELVANIQTLYDEARLARLGSEKFMLDGRHSGTGGGNHVTLGATAPVDSPCLRRPDLLMSLIAYWQNHPALSYLFSRPLLPEAFEEFARQA